MPGTTVAESSSSNPFDNWPDEDPVKAMHNKYTNLRDEWRRSRVGKRVTNALKQRVLNREDIEITDVICLGLGSIDRGGSNATSSIGQLAALIGCVDLLKTKHTISNIFFQDPRFRLNDIQFLRMLDYDVLFDNAALMLLKDTTFLISAYCPWSEVLCLFSHVSPALYMGTDLFDMRGCDDSIMMGRLTWSLQQPPIRGFFESRASFAFPFSDTKLDQQWGDKLRNMKLYWSAAKGQKVDTRVKRFYKKTPKFDMTKLDLADDELDSDELEERMEARSEIDSDELDDVWSDMSG